MMKLVWLGAAGVAGTLARYGLSGWVQRISGVGFPWGTFAVNLLGCFVFGLIWALAEYRLALSSEVRTVLLLGFLGAFTTFSSFAFETTQLLRDSQYVLAFLNIAGQNILGIAGLFAGLTLGRMV
ncbi:MAG: fluoride efflux transporter CrcB [Candidatus Zixiibacteriota bacterium]